MVATQDELNIFFLIQCLSLFAVAMTLQFLCCEIKNAYMSHELHIGSNRNICNYILNCVQQYLELCTLQLCNPCQYALLNCDRKYLRYVIFAKFLEAMHFEVCNFWYFYSKLCNFLRYAIFLIDYIAEGFTVFQNLTGQNISREIKRIWKYN